MWLLSLPWKEKEIVERAHLLPPHIGLEKLTSLPFPLVKTYHMATYVQRRLGNVVPIWTAPSQPPLFTLEEEEAECLGGSQHSLPWDYSPFQLSEEHFPAA